MDINNLKKHFFKSIVSDCKEENKDIDDNNDELSILSHIGNSIRIIRKYQNRTISHIADMAQMSPKYLQGVEVGKRNISITNLNKIAKVLNIPVSFLVYDYQNTENNKKLLSIVMKLKNYSIEELENIDNIINDIKRIEK
ncbi:helix-turn-helix transcriptional regulator [uncultured Brachyspira sp.]|uniref:helix-turn-helix domain-containing protein n=1 Tax=uncultured Brachyspira sp. TaxID=221953 RepID=UPI0025E6E615|nr:helix-turn-helix transcriptional regulator [uncultured Brachyspira sp.]